MASGDVTEKRLGGPVQPGTSTGVIFTVPSGHTYVIKQIIACNTDGSSHTLSVGIGTAATAANLVLSAAAIAANVTTTYNLMLVLVAGETLQALADSAGKITVTIDGWDHEV